MCSTGGLDRLRDLGLARVSDVREGVVNGTAIVETGVRPPGGERLILVLRKPLNDTRAAVDAIRNALPLALVVGGAVALALALALALSRGLLLQLRRLRDDARALGTEGLGHNVHVGRHDEVGEVAGALETTRSRLARSRRSSRPTASSGSQPTGSTSTASTARRRSAPSRSSSSMPPGCCSAKRRSDWPRTAARWRSPALRRSTRSPTPPRCCGSCLCCSTMPAPTARIDIRGEGERVVVRVTDEGRGLSVADREHVFERFERGEAGSAHPGFGLGLAIARGLAGRMHGGLEAPLVARGGCFELWLPSWDDAPT
jgi:HAMP domain-containing protein